MRGQGDSGPALDNNPIVTQASGLEAIVRNGRGRMPPVGTSWTKAQLDGLLAYLKQNVYKGASASGG